MSRAREAQARRLGGARVNADMDDAEVRRWCRPDRESLARFRATCARLDLSARGYVRVLKVARTLADLGGRPDVAWEDLAQALHYRHRSLERSGTMG